MDPNLATRWYIVNTYIMSHTCDIKYTYIKKLGMVISKRLTQYLGHNDGNPLQNK